MNVTPASWSGLWHALGAATADEALFGRLVAAYSEPHRHYHTLQHLRECFAHFEAARQLAQRPAEIALALWFHDAVYDARRDDNEKRSADWARRSARDAGLPAEVAQRVHALVMETRHRDVPADPDARLLVDIDLAILGAPPQRFEESDMQIRREYAHVPEPDFRQGRCRVLQSFLDRPAIYGTEQFHQTFEAQARDNLRRAMARWSSSS